MGLRLRVIPVEWFTERPMAVYTVLYYRTRDVIHAVAERLLHRFPW